MTNDELFDLIRSAYLRGYSWAKENGLDETALFAAKAAYDYADKTTSEIETTPTPSIDITDEMVERAVPFYAEGGCIGLTEYEIKEAIASILYEALNNKV